MKKKEEVMPNSDGADFIEEKKVDSIVSHQENHPSSDQVSTKASELETAKAEMGEVRQENERLKMVLQHIKKDYQSLQLRFFDIVKQDHQNPEKSIACTDDNNSVSKHDRDQTEESELVSLSLGRSPRSEAKNIIAQDANNKNLRDQNNDQNNHGDHDLKASLTLGLGSEVQLSTELVTDPSPENSSEEVKELAEAHASNGDQAWQSSNGNPKTLRNDGVDQDVSHEQPPAKRARVSVRARCDTPTMNDGCQWRKYGQKISKGNPCPRAYYRCTVAPSCPVRKQVQRCAEDLSILITTYEGTHNHPLPVTATAMASTTSAAASMLLSGSSASSDPTNVGFGTTANKNATPTVINGLNFGHFDTMRTKAQFYLPNSSTTSSPLFPTITLDLTTSSISSSSSSSSTHFNRSSLSSSLARIPSSSLSFGNSSEPNILPTLWGNNGSSSYLGYGNTMLPYDKAHIGSLNLGKQSHDFLYQRSTEKFSNQGNLTLHESLTETLTKAITSDPGAFKSVIAAAISSMVGGRETHHGRQDGAEKLGQGLMLGEQAATAVSHNNIPPLMQNGKGLASSYFNRLSSSNL